MGQDRQKEIKMSTKVLVIIIAAVVLMLGAMGGGFMLMWSKMNSAITHVQGEQGKEGHEKGAKPKEENALGPVFKMDTLIVNLADQGGKRYLRVTMELELSGPEVLDEITKRLPQLRDTILMVLPSKLYSDINTTEGKVALRDELITKMNAILKSGKVKTIYFTEFVVQ
jgi:flagellar protein FliL